jgi:hypothetical protein
MTAWVVSVLFSPRNMPDRMTATISVTRELVKIAITRVSAASSRRLTYRVLGMPNLRCARGATTTAKMASSTPQAVNTYPSWWMPRFIGNGL